MKAFYLSLLLLVIASVKYICFNGIPYFVFYARSILHSMVNCVDETVIWCTLIQRYTKLIYILFIGIQFRSYTFVVNNNCELCPVPSVLYAICILNFIYRQMLIELLLFHMLFFHSEYISIEYIELYKMCSRWTLNRNLL